ASRNLDIIAFLVKTEARASEVQARPCQCDERLTYASLDECDSWCPIDQELCACVATSPLTRVCYKDGSPDGLAGGHLIMTFGLLEMTSSGLQSSLCLCAINMSPLCPATPLIAGSWRRLLSSGGICGHYKVTLRERGEGLHIWQAGCSPALVIGSSCGTRQPLSGGGAKWSGTSCAAAREEEEEIEGEWMAGSRKLTRPSVCAGNSDGATEAKRQSVQNKVGPQRFRCGRHEGKKIETKRSVRCG
ncbi:hypothetical protein KUCAC02_001116, partial [Chaenocephalus aceratus]